MTKFWVLMGVLLLGGCASSNPSEPGRDEKTEKPEKTHHFGIRDRF